MTVEQHWPGANQRLGTAGNRSEPAYRNSKTPERTTLLEQQNTRVSHACGTAPTPSEPTKRAKK